MNRFILRAQLRAVLPHGVVLHASSVVKNGLAVLFLARSGGGKSTIAVGLSRSGCGVIADDSVVVARGTDGVVRALPCGSMKQMMGTEKIDGAPLGRLFFLEKGAPGFVRRITPDYAFYRAVRTGSIMAYGSVTPGERREARAFLKELFTLFPVYILRYHSGENPGVLVG